MKKKKKWKKKKKCIPDLLGKMKFEVSFHTKFGNSKIQIIKITKTNSQNFKYTLLSFS